MYLYTLNYSEEEDFIKDQIDNLIEYLYTKNKFFVSTENGDNENLKEVKFSYIGDAKDPKNKFKLYLSVIIYKVIINNFMTYKLRKYLKNNYVYLNCNDYVEIEEMFKEVLLNEDYEIDDDSIFFINIKNYVINIIINYFSEFDELNIEGFIKFRSKEIDNEIEVAINKLVERFMIEKEYNEFIKLLKYFVEMQENKIDEVHILIEKNGEYLIKNKYGEDILDLFSSSLNTLEYTEIIKTEDLIISGLITQCPKYVFIYGTDNALNTEILDTIKKVFEDRAFFNEQDYFKPLKNFNKNKEYLIDKSLN